MSDSQDDILRFLGDPATHGGAEVTHVQTHGAHVFLAGNRALKIKRAVAYDYMDFSTLDAREAMLRRELELNCPAAPEIYRRVMPITRAADGRLALDGAGEVVEWALCMARFPKENELSAIAERGDLDDRMAMALGHAAAIYHAAAPERPGPGAPLMAAIVTELEDAFARMTAELGEAPVAAFRSGARAELERIAPLLDARAEQGHVRRCHGDLHLHNLVLIGDRPVPFDALEFDEVLGTCDVLYDLAFLLMDLRHRGLERQASIALSDWLFEAGGREDSGLAALPFFLSIRAAIRAMVEIQTGEASGREAEAIPEARTYLREALDYLRPQPARLVAVGGLSGSGKTTLSRALAPLLHAVHLRSDLERKRLAGVDPLDHLPAGAYTAEASRAVYHVLLERAGALLDAGSSVIVDATWLAHGERDTLEDMARQKGQSLAAFWLEAPEGVLKARVSARHGDASDADADVVALQEKVVENPGSWMHIDADHTPEETLARARKRLGV